jgi:hypothetical protein
LSRKVDLGAGIAAELQRHERESSTDLPAPVGPTMSMCPHIRHGWRKTVSSRSRGLGIEQRRAIQVSVPARPTRKKSGIRWARLSVWTRGWRTLA